MNADYRGEADALDARIQAAIDTYFLDDDAFFELALDLFAHQIRWNEPYAKYARSRGFDARRMPKRLEEIPAVPAAAFKEFDLTTVGAERAALYFETSGTTVGRGGRHYLETTRLYDDALMVGFDRAMLDDGARLRYFLLTPDRPHSSLGYMMERVVTLRGDERTRRFVRGDDLNCDAFLNEVGHACDDEQPVCIATTAFALVALLDALDERETTVTLPPGSRIMETGGFKGRSRVVERDDLYAAASAKLGIPTSSIVAEYGMTELTSQYYDSHASRTSNVRFKEAPPWLKPIVVDPLGMPVAPGVVGAIRHIDLANRSSVIAIETEDLGALLPGGLVLLGRERGAELRGCSLDAETLAARR
jgi:hypothetical protein